jgi:hypothetical protein
MSMSGSDRRARVAGGALRQESEVAAPVAPVVDEPRDHGERARLRPGLEADAGLRVVEHRLLLITSRLQLCQQWQWSAPIPGTSPR